MTREARLVSGIILISLPTIQYGGYFLLTSLMNKGSGYVENPLRQNFFRAARLQVDETDEFDPEIRAPLVEAAESNFKLRT